MQKYSADTLIVSPGNVKSYAAILGINIKNLKGKEILDIGSGYGIFQEECDKNGIAVIALDPLYKKSEKGKYLINRKDKIAGINEVLPFKNESFDMVLSNISSFFYLCHNYPEPALRRSMAKKMLKEVLRVLKYDGEARISAITERELYESILEEVFKNSKSKISWKFATGYLLNYLVLYKH